ncbi:MAG: prolipoprotein diacylglyceryl transferase [Thermomicrobiales bacterium]
MPLLEDPIAISLGGFDVRWYALFILGGIIGAISLSFLLAEIRSRETPGITGDFLLDIAPPVVIVGLVGARLYYVLLKWEYFSENLGEAINVRGGGMTIHGGLIAGILMIWFLCRRARQPFFAWIDLIAPGAALGQAVGRWGNWANQEAFGTPTDLPWAVTIDPNRRPTGYEQNATYHPTFLYESVFNLANAVLLSWLVVRVPRTRWMRDGDVAGTYLILYGIVRFLIERIRTDSLYIGPLPAAYWLSFGMIGAGLLLMVGRRMGESRT